MRKSLLAILLVAGCSPTDKREQLIDYFTVLLSAEFCNVVVTETEAEFAFWFTAAATDMTKEELKTATLDDARVERLGNLMSFDPAAVCVTLNQTIIPLYKEMYDQHEDRFKKEQNQ